MTDTTAKEDSEMYVDVTYKPVGDGAPTVAVFGPFRSRDIAESVLARRSEDLTVQQALIREER